MKLEGAESVSLLLTEVCSTPRQTVAVGIVFSIYTIKNDELSSPGKELKEGKIQGKKYNEINVNIYLCGSASKSTCSQSWQPESCLWG